jgi:seryl-tRNA synthetase
MHDARVFREQVELLREGMRRRQKLDELAPMLDRGVALELERRTIIQAVEERKAARNATSQKVARRKKAGEKADELIVSGRQLGEEIQRLEDELATAETELRNILLGIPNITLPDVPGGGEEANKVVRTWGTPRATDGVRPHWEIGEERGLIDLTRGAKISGSGFIVFRGLGARLTRALMNFFIDVHVREHGYEEVWVPVVVNRASMTGTTQLPKFEEDMYALKDEDLFLIPTAEVPVTNLYRDEIVDSSTLPRGFVAYSACFRREAGAAGKDTRGLLRVHEFDKVEMVRYSTPEQGDEEHEKMTRHAETLLERLGLPHRRVLLSAGDTGFGAARCYDLEVSRPVSGSTVSSAARLTQARANIRYRPAQGETASYTLNGSPGVSAESSGS